MRKVILFQGDSITDSGRKNDWGHNMGFGYATMVGGTLGAAEPTSYEFINKGVSGNRIVDLYARIKKDIINLKPDYMSILVGVNDVAVGLKRGTGFDVHGYMEQYDTLLRQMRVLSAA